MKIDSKELSDYVVSVLNAVSSSQDATIKKFTLSQGVTFDLKVVHKKGAKGGLRILIANAEGDYEKEVVSRITFTMQHKEAMKTGIKVFTDMFSQLAEIDKKPQSKSPKKINSKSKKKNLTRSK